MIVQPSQNSPFAGGDTTFVGTGMASFYKIKNEKNETIAYLFGTIHEIPTNQSFSLNEKIFQKMQKCKRLFTEVKEISTIEEDNSVERILHSYAIENGKEIGGLETGASREAAEEVVKEETEYLGLKKNFIRNVALWKANNYIDQLNSYLSSSPGPTLEGIVSYLIDGAEWIVGAIQHTTWTEWNEEFTERLELVAQQYIDGLRAVPDEPTQALADQIKLLIENKKSHEYQKRVDKNITSAIQHAFATGNTQPAQGAIMQVKKFKGDEHQVFKNVEDKRLASRDSHMIDSILSNLRQCNLDERDFNAVGRYHLEGDYENLKIKLEIELTKMGYKLIKAS